MTDRMHDETADETNDAVDEVPYRDVADDEPYFDTADDEEDEQSNEAIAAEEAAAFGDEAEEEEVEADAQVEDNALLQEPPRAFAPTIDLPTPHHWRLVKVAIDDRVSALKSIAKKVSDEGYIREARIMEHDALALSEDVSPQLEVQAEIPLATADEVQSGVANELRGVVRRHVRRDQQDVDHEAQMLKELSERVERFACEVANRAYAAGLSAREATAEVFALKSLNALRR